MDYKANPIQFDGQGCLNRTHIFARDLPEAWFLCLKACLDHGYDYTIDRGSYAGQKRKEFDAIDILIKYPGTRPLVPDTPPSIPPPTTQEYIEGYLSYLMTGSKGEKEQYTYGEDLEKQIPEVIKMYKEDGYNTNQACMTVGSANSIILKDPQCLRLIDTRIRYGKLHFFVYFRSWDLFGGFPANLAATQILKEYMASEIGVEDGELIAYSKGLHLYDHYWEIVESIVRR